jgi:hypothetical protein
MNNSFPRLIDGMCATLRSEVLTRLHDEFARGQVFGVINLLNTFKVRADWSLRESCNRGISDLLGWLDAERAGLAPKVVDQIEQLLRTAMREEVGIELKNSPRPLFAEMSSGSED